MAQMMKALVKREAAKGIWLEEFRSHARPQ
jgi:hypothetical protein